jgi:recombination protein RecT
MSQELTILKQSDFKPIQERFIELVNPENFQREVSFALQILDKNAYLAKSSKQSILQSVLNVAQIGLSLNPVLKLAYLVPRWNRASNGVECYLEPSYQGLVKLLTDTKSIVNIEAHLIYEGDDVVLDMASDRKVVKHVPYVLNKKDKGAIMGVYSLATLHDGSKSVEVMSIGEVYEIRERSESYKKAKEKHGMTTVWVTDEGEMIRKTVIRRHFKYLPKSENFEKAAEAIKLDETDYPASHAQWAMITNLLHTAVISEEKKEQIERECNSYTSIEASMSIEYLLQNQPTNFIKELGEDVRRETSKA